MPTPAYRAMPSGVALCSPDAKARRAASTSRSRFRWASARTAFVSTGANRRLLRFCYADKRRVLSITFHHAPRPGRNHMTAPTTSPQAPGGTARLAGHPVARVGFGAMQLAERAGRTTPQSRDAALGVLRHAVERGVNH